MDRNELKQIVLDKITDKENIICGSIISAYLIDFESFDRNLYNEMYSDTIMNIGNIGSTSILLDSHISVSDLNIYDIDMNKLVDLSEYQQYVF